MITVFTPSYNRANTLPSLYDSLLKQIKTEFEWLIVDDGSSDNTKEYVDALICDNKITIHYIYQKNAGKQAAYNVGLQNAKGDIFLCVDSDDILAENCLKTIENDFSKMNDNNLNNNQTPENNLKQL